VNFSLYGSSGFTTSVALWSFITFSPVFYCISPFSPKRNQTEGIPLGFCAMGSSLVVVVLIWVVVLVLV
jgi:hypothetical protein